MKQQIRMGRMACLSFGAAQDSSKVKVKVVLAPASGGANAPFVAESLLAHLQSIRQVAIRGVAVDRGHRHSDGSAEVRIWISPVVDDSAEL